MTTYQAAVFDLDGTLVDTESRSRVAWTGLFESHGAPYDDELLDSFVGRRGRDVLPEVIHLFPGRTVEELTAWAAARSRELPPADEIPGAVAYVRAAAERGAAVAVVTSGGRVYAENMIDGLGLSFPVLITADDVRAGKPDPEGFARACALLGVPAAAAVAFEDSPAGIAAAKGAGLACVGLATTHDAAQLSAADLVAADFTHLSWPLSAAN